MGFTKNEIEAELTTIEGWRDGDRGKVTIMSPYFKNEEDAILFASFFPKSIGAKKFILGGTDIGVVWYVAITVRNVPGATQGEKNETGRNRLLRALRILKKNGVDVVTRVPEWKGETSPYAMRHWELHAEFLRVA